jgi:hypothetical protein
MLCEPCSAKWLSCLDLRTPPPPVRLHTIGRDLPGEIEAERQRRSARHAEVVREYGAQLVRDCSAGKHVSGTGSPA